MNSGHCGAEHQSDYTIVLQLHHSGVRVAVTVHTYGDMPKLGVSRTGGGWKPYEFIGLAALDGSKPYEFIGINDRRLIHKSVAHGLGMSPYENHIRSVRSDHSDHLDQITFGHWSGRSVLPSDQKLEVRPCSFRTMKWGITDGRRWSSRVKMVKQAGQM